MFVNKLIKYDLFYFVLFSRTTPLPQIGLWTFEPAFSPRVSFPLSPRSIFQTSQRFSPTLSPRSLFSHWSAVSPSKSRDFRFHEPAILFTHWSAVSPTQKPDFRFRVMTSLICSRPIRSQEICHTGALYY